MYNPSESNAVYTYLPYPTKEVLTGWANNLPASHVQTLETAHYLFCSLIGYMTSVTIKAGVLGKRRCQ